MWKYRHGTQTPTNLTLAGIHIAQKWSTRFVCFTSWTYFSMPFWTVPPEIRVFVRYARGKQMIGTINTVSNNTIAATVTISLLVPNNTGNHIL
jgi:hypothetical protein